MTNLENNKCLILLMNQSQSYKKNSKVTRSLMIWMNMVMDSGLDSSQLIRNDYFLVKMHLGILWLEWPKISNLLTLALVTALLQSGRVKDSTISQHLMLQERLILLIILHLMISKEFGHLFTFLTVWNNNLLLDWYSIWIKIKMH